MKPAITNKELNPPLSWHDVAQGEWLRGQLESAISPMLSRMFGYYLLALGPLAEELDTSAAQVRQKIKVHEWAGADLKAHICQLPFKENSVDSCLLPFALDFSRDPHQLLREAHRVVIPDGYLLIAGFNPFSLLLFGKALPHYKRRFPWSGRSFSRYRVKDWLQLLGCEIVQEQNLVWSSLLGSGYHTELGQHWGQKYLPCMASAYVVLARKREIPLTPAKPVWKKLQKIKVGGFSGAGVAGRHY